MARLAAHQTATQSGASYRTWSMHSCATCGGVILAMTPQGAVNIASIWPEAASVSDTVPERAREFLIQALGSLHAPAGAVMLAASSVDAMLKEKGLTTGNLYSSIDEAAKNHLITDEMAAWGHEVKLGTNDQRHEDENAPLPQEAEAKKVIEFAQALAQFLFVLPAMVTRGREACPATPLSATDLPTTSMPEYHESGNKCPKCGEEYLALYIWCDKATAYVHEQDRECRVPWPSRPEPVSPSP